MFSGFIYACGSGSLPIEKLPWALQGIKETYVAIKAYSFLGKAFEQGNHTD